MKKSNFFVLLPLSLLWLAPLNLVQAMTTGDSIEIDQSIAEHIPDDPTCLAKPEVCQRQAEKREEMRQRCQEDPEWCKQWRAERMRLQAEKRQIKEKCKEQPDKCEEIKKQYREERAKKRQDANKKRKEAQKQWCEQNRNECRRWKADKKKLHEEYLEKLRQLAKEKYPTRPF